MSHKELIAWAQRQLSLYSDAPDGNYVKAKWKQIISALESAEQGEPVGITLTGKQLRNAIEFVNPDGVGDLDQLECEVTIRHFNDAIDGDGEPMPSGIYAYLAEYPEEGRVSLDADLAPQPDRKAIEDGFAIVPIEPSQEMLIAAWNAMTIGCSPMIIAPRGKR